MLSGLLKSYYGKADCAEVHSLLSCNCVIQKLPNVNPIVARHLGRIGNP